MRNQTDHRPWPLPDRPWAMAQRWHDLLFMHWPVRPAILRPFIPAALELQSFDGWAWLAVVPFRMSGVRPRFVPPVPWLSAFPELNLRTYVSDGRKPGVWFFSLDAGNPVAVEVARGMFHLNYYHAQMAATIWQGAVRYASRRTHPGAPPAAFVGRYRPTGPVYRSTPGTLEHWLTERYCLYAANRRGRLWRAEIHHAPWPLQPAEAEVRVNTLPDEIGARLGSQPPILHFARRLDVRAWLPERVSG